MKKRLLLVVLAVVLLSGLAQCGPTQAPAQSTSPPAQPASGEGQPTGVTLKLIDTSEGHAFAFQKLAAEYEKMSGTKLEVEILPYEATYEKEVLTLSTGGSDYDLIVYDCIWGSQYQKNGWVLDLKPFIDNPDLPKLDVAGFVPGLLETWHVRGDAVYGIPVDFTTILMAYRTDLFEEAGLSGPPKTWAEFVDYAERLSKDTDGDGKIDQYGFIWAGGIPDSAMSEWTVRLQGFTLPAGLDEFVLNSDATKTAFMEGANRQISIDALQLLLDARPYGPPGASGFDYGEALQNFAQGKGAMFMSWQVYFFEFEDPAKSQVAGKVGYAAPPIQDAQNYYVGGWQMSVSKFSKNPEEAYKFLAWIGSDEGQKKMIEAGSITPYRKFVFESPEYLEKYPVIAATADLMAGNTLPLPLTAKYVEMQQLLFEQLTAAFTDQKSAEEALQQAADEIDGILKE